MAFAKTASEAAHWKPPGSFVLCESEAAATKRQSANENPTTRYDDQQKKDRPK